MLRVLIADDHPIVREGLKRLIQGEFATVLIEEVASGEAALEKIQACDWDIVILDIGFPDKSGLEVLREAKKLQKNIAFLMLSVNPEEPYARQALKTGAHAYVRKNSVPYELIKAIHTIRRGGKYINPTVAPFLIAKSDNDPSLPLHSRLSDREIEVLTLVSNGKTFKEIGAILSISQKTVSTYRSRILMKLHLRNTVELIRYAVDQGIAQ